MIKLLLQSLMPKVNVKKGKDENSYTRKSKIILIIVGLERLKYMYKYAFAKD